MMVRVRLYIDMSKKTVNKQIQHTILKKVFAISILALVFLAVASVWANPPYDVTWELESFESDTYNMEDLIFVWGGDTGNATDTEITGCSQGNCRFQTSYNETGIHEVSVYAKNIAGDVVTNTATCRADVQQECPCEFGYTCVNNRCIYGMEVECGGYTTPSAQNPTLFFDPGATVYWRPTVVGGQGPYTYSWNVQTENETIRDRQETSGPFYIATVGGTIGDYLAGSTYTAEVAVRDANNAIVNASCTMATKQCQFNEDCQTLGFPSNYYCNQGTFTCVPPDPVFVQTLAVDKGVVNQGSQCNLSWEVDNATRCDVYRNNELYRFDTDTATSSFTVDPGTYHVQCLNEVDEMVTAGPAQCIYNPEIRES
jgi:hypothetical protein